MAIELIIIAAIILIVVAAFGVGWWLGSKNTEHAILLKGANDVVKKQIELVKSSNRIDDVIDGVKSMLE